MTRKGLQAEPFLGAFSSRSSMLDVFTQPPCVATVHGAYCHTARKHYYKARMGDLGSIPLMRF